MSGTKTTFAILLALTFQAGSAFAANSRPSLPSDTQLENVAEQNHLTQGSSKEQVEDVLKANGICPCQAERMMKILPGDSPVQAAGNYGKDDNTPANSANGFGASAPNGAPSNL